MWSADLGKEFLRTEWKTSFHFTHKSTVSCYSQEKNYKILWRWYRDPSTFHQIFLSTPASCWCCGTASGNYMSGGNVRGYTPSGHRYYKYIMQCTKNLQHQLLRFTSSLCSPDLLHHKKRYLLCFTYSQHSNSFLYFGRLPLNCLCLRGFLL